MPAISLIVFKPPLGGGAELSQTLIGYPNWTYTKVSRLLLCVIDW